MNLFKRFSSTLNYFSKRETLRYLQAMPQRQLIDCGFSPALVDQGMAAWPWREDKKYKELSIIEQKLDAEKRGINELQRYSDAELADIGICRGTIKESVRYGRFGIESAPADKAA